MSPVGGVGINLAVQDAVATARLLAPSLTDSAAPLEERVLARVQRRRALPTVLTQGMQRVVQRLIIMPGLNGREVTVPRLLSRVLKALPILSAVPAYIVGVGFRPERAPAWARRPGRSSSPATERAEWPPRTRLRA